MKKLSKIFFTFLILMLIGCTEYEALDTYTVEKPESVVIQEGYDSYQSLKSYVDTTKFNLVTIVNPSTYLSGEVTYRLINENFNQVSFKQGLDHKDLVDNAGNIDTTSLGSLYDKTQQANMDIFGSALISSKNQNVAYLNGLLTPVAVQNPVIDNSLEKSGLNDNTFSGWTYTNDADVTITEFNGNQVVQMKTASDASWATDLRLTSPEIPVTPGSVYEVVFYIRSNGPGKGRIAFDGLINNTPELDYSGSGELNSTFSTDVEWKEIRFQISDFTEDTFKLFFDFGYTPNVNYQISVGSLYVYNTQAQAGSENVWLEAECGQVGSMWSFSTERADYSGTGYITIPDLGNQNTTPGTIESGNNYYTFTIPTSGDYTLYIRSAADNAGSDSFHARIDDSGWTTINGPLNHPDFRWDRVNQYPLTAGTHTLTAAFREDGLRIDKFYIGLNGAQPDDSSMGGAATNCEIKGFDLMRSDAEKEKAVDAQMKSWLAAILTYSKNYVTAWNVVDEPMDDSNPSELKTNNGEISQVAFYWQDFLGKEYGVKAFDYARQYVSDNDLLFISEDGLVTNPAKTQGLLDYVHYIENAGAEVDGIAIKMNLTINSDRDQIKSMFELLATSGKIIAVSELSVNLDLTGNQERNADVLEQQLLMYQFVIETFLNTVPESQQYGIIFKDPVDNDNSENSGLWDARAGLERKYIRKPAYKGVVEGLVDTDMN